MLPFLIIKTTLLQPVVGHPAETMTSGDAGDLRKPRGNYGNCEWLFVHAYEKIIARNGGKHDFEWPTDYRPIFILSVSSGQLSPHFDNYRLACLAAAPIVAPTRVVRLFRESVASGIPQGSGTRGTVRGRVSNTGVRKFGSFTARATSPERTNAPSSSYDMVSFSGGILVLF